MKQFEKEINDTKETLKMTGLSEEDRNALLEGLTTARLEKIKFSDLMKAAQTAIDETVKRHEEERASIMANDKKEAKKDAENAEFQKVYNAAVAEYSKVNDELTVTKKRLETKEKELKAAAGDATAEKRIQKYITAYTKKVKQLEA